MFTGIIEEIGRVRQLQKGAHSARITIAAHKVLEGTEIGDSIAVNGVCLTVTALKGDTFQADIMHETLNFSTLGCLTSGAQVNLERAMAAKGRFGGHIVSGHIDGTGRITRIEQDDTAIRYTIASKPELLRYIIKKGSIAMDGISLTVTMVTSQEFGVSVIPHTADETVLSGRRVGEVVNLETDVIGKYVEKMLGFTEEDGRVRQTQQSGKIDRNFLQKYGF